MKGAGVGLVGVSIGLDVHFKLLVDSHVESLVDSWEKERGLEGGPDQR